jgi:8-oxo-dGTP diphosphatase
MHRGQQQEEGYLLIASGYLVAGERVLLVHHRRFDKWVPPGGHVDPDETFAEAAEREFREETGIAVRALSAAPAIHPPDSNATPTPAPFYCDVERDGFARPALTQFFFVTPTRGLATLQPQLDEVSECRWFGADELAGLNTFAQVRSVAAHALAHHPAPGGSVPPSLTA